MTEVSVGAVYGFDEVVNHLPDAVAALDEQWRFIQLNDAAAQRIGQPREQILGRTLWEVEFYPLDDDVRSELHRAMQDRIVVAIEHTAAPDRRRHWHVFPAGNGLTLIVRDTGVERERPRPGLSANACFRAAHDFSPQPFVMLSPVRDAEGRIIDFTFEYVNAAAAALLHRSCGDLEQSRLLAAFPNAHRDIFEMYISAIETGETHDREIRYDGEGIRGWFRNTVFKVNDLVANSMQDITAQKEAEQALRVSEHRVVSVLQNMSDGFVLINRDYQVEFLNRTGEEYFRKTCEEVIGRSVLEIYPQLDGSPVFKAIEHTMTTGKSADKEIASTIWPGRWVHLRTNACEEYVAVFFRDLTARKNMEQSLRDLAGTLEQRVASRTRELRRKAEQLQQMAHELAMAEHRERQRLAQVLHDELQQLLVAVKLRLNLLRRRDPKTLQELSTLTEGLDFLLSESIDLARNMAVELAPPVLELGMEPALRWLGQRFGERHHLRVHLHIDASAAPRPPQVCAFVLRAVQELLLNVVKHADTHEAWVTLESAGHDRVRITVEDHGCGCPPDVITALEQQTEQRSYGLASIRHRLQLMGGSMEIHPVDETGCRITMLLPRG